jgi:hypothetical protein
MEAAAFILVINITVKLRALSSRGVKPLRVSKWSDNCVEKIDNNKAGIWHKKTAKSGFLSNRLISTFSFYQL